MKMKTVLSAVLPCLTAFVATAGVNQVELDRSPDRVKSPLRVDLKRIGTLRPRGANEIADSNWTLGCEVLDRDFANFDEYCDYIVPLGIKTIRLHSGIGFAEGQTFELGTVDVPATKCVKLVVSGGVAAALAARDGRAVQDMEAI